LERVQESIEAVRVPGEETLTYRLLRVAFRGGNGVPLAP